MNVTINPTKIINMNGCDCEYDCKCEYELEFSYKFGGKFDSQNLISLENLIF